jgi:uncharacterized protein YggT (Ycf19 family)
MGINTLPGFLLLLPFPYPVLRIVLYALNIYELMIFVWVVVSWMYLNNRIARNIYQFLTPIVSPYVNLFRFVPPVGGVDLSPLIAIMALRLLARFL